MLRPIAALALTTLLVLSPSPLARAQSNNNNGTELGNAIAGLITGAINQARMNRVTRTWANVDPDIQKCLADRYNTPVSALIQNYVGADDYRLREPIANCTQIVAQQRQQAAAEESARQAAAAAEAQAQQQAAAAREAEATARRTQLTQRYGSTMAATILSGQVNNGMTPDQVRAALGQPLQIEQLTPTDAIWHYSSRRVYLSNGRVVGVRSLN
ncbi:MAG: hypothetical protein HY054_08575 [Proteobacteria bacterium]|nr:hypothetical protein [Pseudomonadota bacterium]